MSTSHVACFRSSDELSQVSTSHVACFRSSDELSQVSTSHVGTQDEHGIPVSLFGQLGSVALFDEALSESKVQALHALGPNQLSVYQVRTS